MKKGSKWRILWIGGIYALLLLILYLVITYKVEWEDKDLKTYLYFYQVEDHVLASSTKPRKYINKIVCANDICPYIEHINDNILILNDMTYMWLYDYVDNKIISDNYKTYRYLRDDLYIVKDNKNEYNIIDKDNNKIFNKNYDNITDYKDNYLTYIKDNQYHMVNTENDFQIAVPEDIDNIKIINDRFYLYEKDNKYFINNYGKTEPVKEYNYILSIEDVILVFNDKKFDILNKELKSQLMIPINTTYEYLDINERKTIKTEVFNKILVINIYVEDNKYTQYKYDLANNKLL